MLSQAAPVTFSWTKFKRMSFSPTPRSDSKCNRLMFTPTNTRPLPRVCARSAKMGPGDTEVRTGAPPSKRNVEPPLVALAGILVTFVPTAFPRNEIRIPF